MGKNKAFLEIRGQRLIDRIRDLFLGLFDETLLVTHAPLDYLDLDIRIVADLIPGKGSLGGLYTGLFYASHSHAFVAACDMPLLNKALIRYLVDLSGSFDVVIPKTEEGWQPLHSVYSAKCIPFIEELLGKDDLKIIDFFPKIKKRIVPSEEILPFDPKHLSFFNVNTPEDLLRADHLLPELILEKDSTKKTDEPKTGI